MKEFVIITSLLPTLIFSSCNPSNILERESAAINEISSLYGGTCTHTLNLNASTEYGTTKSVDLEISNSDFLDENTKWTEMFAANIAYVFFTFVKKKNYHTVKSSIIYGDGGKISFDYSFDTLEIVDKKMTYVRQVIDVLKNGDLTTISELMKPGILPNEKEKLEYLRNLESADSTFGQIIDFTPTGFKFNSATNGLQFLHISGNLKRSKLDTQFSIDINPTTGEDTLYFFRYEW